MPRPVSTKSTVGKARALLEISAKQLSDRAGVGTSTIQKIEAGKFPLSPEIAKKLGNAMLVDPTWLMYGDPEENVRGIGGQPVTSADVPAMNVTGDYLRNPDEWTQEHRAKMEETARHLHDGFGRLLTRALKDGKYLQIGADMNLFFRQLVSTYYPEDSKHFSPESTPTNSQPAITPNVQPSSESPSEPAT